jgi:hypothetical protein
MSGKKGKTTQKVEEVNLALGPQVRVLAPRPVLLRLERMLNHSLAQAKEGENVFGVAHIFASFNDTFVHVTDISGRETVRARVVVSTSVMMCASLCCCASPFAPYRRCSWPVPKSRSSCVSLVA